MLICVILFIFTIVYYSIMKKPQSAKVNILVNSFVCVYENFEWHTLKNGIPGSLGMLLGKVSKWHVLEASGSE